MQDRPRSEVRDLAFCLKFALNLHNVWPTVKCLAILGWSAGLPEPSVCICDQSTWTKSWENLFLPYANNKDTDQPAHPRSLICAFVVHCLDSIIPLVFVSEISSLYLGSVAAQAGLCLTWLQTLKTGFLVTGSQVFSHDVAQLWYTSKEDQLAHLIFLSNQVSTFIGIGSNMHFKN